MIKARCHIKPGALWLLPLSPVDTHSQAKFNRKLKPHPITSDGRSVGMIGILGMKLFPLNDPNIDGGLTNMGKQLFNSQQSAHDRA